jgi:hypothetical protein
MDERWVPDACTLPTAEQPLRVADFDRVFRGTQTVDRVSAQHVRLLIRGGDTLAQRLRELAARETQCCSFFTFEVAVASDGVRFDIEVPPGHVDVLDALAARAVAVVSGATE